MVVRGKYVLMIMYLVVNNKFKVIQCEISKSSLSDTLEFIYEKISLLIIKIPPLAKIGIGPPIQYLSTVARKNEGPA